MLHHKVRLVLCLAVLCLSACSRQQSDWEKAVGANTTDAYELFLKKYPSGEFTAQAQARVKALYEQRDWQKARDTDTLEAYQAFLKQYPEGKWSEEARIRVENFTLASTPATAAAPQAPPAAAASPAPKPQKAAKAGSYGIQLGAFKSGADAANKRWAQLQTKFPKQLAGLAPNVLPKKAASGTLYRLQVANLSEKRAQSICKALRAHSQACVVLHP